VGERSDRAFQVTIARLRLSQADIELSTRAEEVWWDAQESFFEVDSVHPRPLHAEAAGVTLCLLPPLGGAALELARISEIDCAVAYRQTYCLASNALQPAWEALARAAGDACSATEITLATASRTGARLVLDLSCSRVDLWSCDAVRFTQACRTGVTYLWAARGRGSIVDSDGLNDSRAGPARAAGCVACSHVRQQQRRWRRDHFGRSRCNYHHRTLLRDAAWRRGTLRADAALRARARLLR